jgi:hypothetical protein
MTGSTRARREVAPPSTYGIANDPGLGRGCHHRMRCDAVVTMWSTSDSERKVSAVTASGASASISIGDVALDEFAPYPASSEVVCRPGWSGARNFGASQTGPDV